MDNATHKGDIAVPITLELGEGLASVVNIERWIRGVTQSMIIVLQQLGIPGSPTVCIAETGVSRPLSIRVHGVMQPYSEFLAYQIWISLAGSDERTRRILER